MSTFSTSSRQKRLKTLSFLHFWLRNVLRATTACTFSTLFPHRNLQKWSETVSFLHFWLGNVLRATTACTFSTSQLPKVVRHWGVFYIFTSKCASRHNGVHFFDIATSKSGPNPWCFVHFDFEMCFAPQRRTLFWHLNFQKWSDAEVFCTFWLGNVLRATTACTFSTSQLPKVVRTWCVLYILTWKCASRHNGVQFFISHLASWLRTRRFSEPTFRLSGATNHWKNTVFRDFPTFSRICIFFLLTLSLLIFSLLIFPFSLPLPCSAFHLSILSEVWLLNFLRTSLTIDITPQSTLDLGLTCTNLAFTNWGTTGSIFPLIHPRAAQRWPRSQAKTRRRRPLRRYRPPGSDSSGSVFPQEPATPIGWIAYDRYVWLNYGKETEVYWRYIISYYIYLYLMYLWLDGLSNQLITGRHHLPR